MTILDKIAKRTKLRVAHYKEKISADEIKSKALSLPRGNFPFEVALRKASPSKGLIAENFPYLEIVR